MATTRIRAFPNSPTSMRKAKDEHFRALVSKAKDENGINRYQIAEAAQVSRATFVSKMKNPGDWTLAQLRDIAELLGWTAADLEKIVIGGKK